MGIILQDLPGRKSFLAAAPHFFSAAGGADGAPQDPLRRIPGPPRFFSLPFAEFCVIL
jgi:hypothetical protein